MKFKYLIITSLWGLLLNFCSLHAQIYAPVTHLSGTQSVNGVNITVTPSTTGAAFVGYCGESPYWIGYGDNVGSYTYTFGTAVNLVRFRFTGLNTYEVISFAVNGVPYTLTATNFSAYAGSCGQGPAAISGGNLCGTTGPAAAIGEGGEINISGSITSVKVEANGIQAGTCVGVYLAFLDVHSNTPVCSGDTLRLYALPDIAGASYSWTGPSGFSSNVQNPVIPNAGINQTGQYSVTATTSVFSISGSADVTIMPTPVTEIIYNTPVCKGSDLYLSAPTTLSSVNYHWEGPGGFMNSSPNPVIPDIQQAQAGLYTLTTTLGQCTYSTTSEISILEPAHHTFSKTICHNEPFQFDGKALNENGVYYDTLTAANGCDSVITLDLTVLPVPGMGVSMDSSKSLCIGDSTLLQANGANGYQWYINKQLIGSHTEELIPLSELWNKIVVVGTFEDGCKDTAEAMVNTNACCDLFIPNVFSPNNDGLNDEFGPETIAHFSDYKLIIFNSWGQRIFESHNIDHKWDGKFNSQDADINSYHYYIKVKCLGGTEQVRKGNFTLLR